MGTFNNKISAEFHPPRKWILERLLSYKNEEINTEALINIGIGGKKHEVRCTKGFVTDLASVPRAIWWLIAPWDIARAAIIHDLLYKKIRLYRAAGGTDKQNIAAAKKASDNVFLMAMKDAAPSVSKWKIYAAYYAVVLFGRWSIIPRKEDLDATR
jgi:hypothetical protein|tara:strand:- start:2903 stop:3370 length:468 start_codon:yes stop_codon:yes gene_type:complete